MKNILTLPETSVELNFEIKPYNIDAAGHVNNAVYINWLEDLRTKLLEKILLREGLKKIIIWLLH